MKRITPLHIVLWSSLFIIGFVFAIAALLVTFLSALFWVLAILIWLGDATWITLAIVNQIKKSKKSGPVLVGNKAVFERMKRETEEATKRYLAAVNRKGLLRGSALYERPWFLLCGTPKSGKTSLLRGSGLNFPLRYPSERDGVVVEGGNQVQWSFGNEAVWIDTPGSFMEESGRDEWQSLVEALRRVRPERPVDGVALVVNISEALAADDLQIKAVAQRLRGRIDEMIARWGIEFPVYLLFSRTDEIPGFKEYFSEQIASGDDQIFGATIAQKGEATTARIQFAEEFALLCKSLTDLRLDRLHKERDAAKKRMICRFVIHFQSVQQKLGTLAAELFKASNYAGKPIFRGFYFTSCGKKPTVEARQEAARQARGPEISATIVNHPLNPNRILVVEAKKPPQECAPVKEELQSLFVLPLFRDIMVRDKPLVTATSKRSRQQMARHYAMLGGIGFAGVLLALFLVSGYAHIAKFYDEASSALSRLPSENASLLEQYAALGVMQGVMGRLQRYDDHTPLSMGIGLYRGAPLLRALKRSYFYRLRRCMVAPAAKFLEYDIGSKSEAFGDLGGEEYDRLYRSLKAYLSISEAVARHPKDIDTVFLRPVLLDAIKQSILSSSGAQRLPEKIEAVLQENMGLLLTYLRRGELPGIQENQQTVTQARSRLRRLPGAGALYEAVAGQLAQNAPQITIDDLLGSQGAGVLSSKVGVSTIYTQEGWDKSMSAALKEAAENPYKVDWVIGLTAQDVPEGALDKGKLLDEMQRAYLADFIKRWSAFLGAVEIAPFADLPQAGRMLQKIAGDQSELQKLLEAVGKATLLKNQSALGKGLMAIASKVKAVSDAAKNAKKNGAGISVPFGGESPFDDLNAVFEQLRTFVSASGGGLGGYAGYKEKTLALVDKINALQSGGDDQMLLAFTGRDDDPLYGGWKYTKNAVGVMQEDLAEGLGKLLLKPFEMTGAAAAQSFTRVLNARWQSDVVKPFVSRFSGRYPFAARGDDASWGDVMDFFRPSTGTFWGFYDRVLSSYVVRTSSGWMVRQLGGLQLNFNPELSAALTSAETVKSVFFKPDGTLRTLDLTVTSAASNKNSGKLELDGQIYDIGVGKSAAIRWPREGQSPTPGATLKIMVGKDSWQEVGFSGQWGLMKLFAAAKVNKTNGSAFNAKWQINVQNMYMLNFDARIQVSAADHPFADPVFQQFSCPADLIVSDPGK